MTLFSRRTMACIALSLAAGRAASASDPFEFLLNLALSSTASDVSTGDWDGDGHDDLALSYATLESVVIVLNDSGTSFTSQTIDVGSAALSIQTMATSCKQLLVALDNQAVMRLDGDLAGTFVIDEDSTFEFIGFDSTLALSSDMDGDGTQSILSLKSTSDVASRTNLDGSDGCGGYPGVDNSATTAGAISFRIGEFVGGSAGLDVVCLDAASRALDVYEYGGDITDNGGSPGGVALSAGPVTALPFISIADPAPTGIEVGNLNSDAGGIDDVAVLFRTGDAVVTMFGDGNGGFVSQQTLAVTGPMDAVIGDFNLDGAPDLVVAGDESGTSRAGMGRLWLFLNSGSGSLQPAGSIALSAMPRAIAAGDFDNDGLDDIAVALNAAGVSLYRTTPGAACAADLSGDGQVDGADLASMLAAWGAGASPADLTGDDAVDGADLAALLAAWGAC